MSDANVRALQYTLNRFNTVAGFASIATDGIMGPGTANAILKSLSWIANSDPTETDTAAGLTTSLVNDDGSYNLAQMASSAHGLDVYLTGEADSLRVKAAQMVATSGGGGGGGGTMPVINAPAPKSAGGVAAGLYAQLANMPTWAKVAGGVVVAAASFAVYKHNKKAHGSLKGFLGLNAGRRRRYA